MRIRLPHKDEPIHTYEAFDFTKLTAIATCPKWGIIRYSKHKSMSDSEREMPLEAGELCHQVFSVIRLFDLYRHGKIVYDQDTAHAAALYRMKQLFPEKLHERIIECFKDEADDEFAAQSLAFYILDMSGYEDNPSDKYRTKTNIELSLVNYIQEYEFGKHIPLVKGDFVGVENAFELVVEYDVEMGTRYYRFTGKIDGVHLTDNNPERIHIEENKTGRQINDLWETGFITSHQITGYMLACQVLIDHMPHKAVVRGLQLPMPRSLVDGIRNVNIRRKDYHYEAWQKFFVHNTKVFEEHQEYPLDAPEFTHSCTRYFRSCSFIPLCASPMEDQVQMYESMYIKEWSPLHDESN